MSTASPTPAPRTMSIGGATEDVFLRTAGDLVGESADGVPSIVLPLGAKIRLEDVIESCGGGAANTAVGLRRLGCNAHVCGVVGSDQWGQRISDQLRHEGVNVDCMTIVEDESSSFSIILSAGSGERVILYEAGTNEHLHDVTFDLSHAITMDWIVLNHIHERSCMIEDDLIALLRENRNIGFTWNPGGVHIREGMHAPLTQALLRETDLLLCNKEEACEFAGTATVEDALDVFVKQGVRTACITDGARGAVARQGNRTEHCPATAVTVVDTTGAGDAFCTGVTWALLQRQDLSECLRTGTILSASVVGRIGAQAGLLTDIEIRQRL